MKKIGIMAMSILTCIIGFVLVGCSFKDPTISFSQDEVVISVDESINLVDYATFENISADDVTFYASNSLVEIDEQTLVGVSSGRTYVYAMYNGSSIATMSVVVKKAFDSPVLYFNEDGLLSWEAVSGIFDGEVTVATEYKIVGTYTSYDEDGVAQEAQEIEIITTDTTFQMNDEGDYALSVTALGTGYFDDSAPSTNTFYVGYMPELSIEDFQWDDGLLSWAIDEEKYDIEKYDAKYQVQVDDMLLQEQSETSIDLTAIFETLSAGEHEIRVYVIDQNDERMTRQSEILSITKLSTPTVTFVDGEIVISPSDMEYLSDEQQFDVYLYDDNEYEKTISFENALSSISTSLDGESAGVYSVEITVKSEGFFFHSDIVLNKVYKLPSVVLSSSGDTDVNSTTLSINVASESAVPGSVETQIVVLGNDFGNVSVQDGKITLQIEQAGNYTLSAMQKVVTESYVSNGETVYVLNSDASQDVSVTKLANFTGEVTHEYDAQGNSVLTFNEVDGATSYALYILVNGNYEKVDEGEYTVQGETITLDGGVESLFDIEGGEISLQIVAVTENNEFTINSAITKTLTILYPPTTAQSGNSTNMTYTWTASENAGGYRLLIYYSLTSVPSASTEPTTEIVETNSYTFENVGYYRVRIYTLSNNENEYISSVNYFEETFYLSEQLLLGEVQLGYDESKIDLNTGATGYYLQIGQTSNITTYQVQIQKGNETAITQNYTYSTGGIYNLTETFDDSSVAYTLTITGVNSDSTIYISTESVRLTIQRIAQASFSTNTVTSDILIEDYKPTTTVTLKNKTGATGLKIYEREDNLSIGSDQDITLTLMGGSIEFKSSYSLSFYYYGTYSDETKLFGETNGIIYLDSAVTTLELQRIDAPTNLRYYDGDLIFAHSATAYVDDYVLELTCVTSSGDRYVIYVRFGSTVTAIYGENSYDLGELSDFLSIASSSVTINLDDLIEQIKGTDLATVYAQAVSVEFSAYAHRTADRDGVIQLSSQYATTQSDASYVLTVEKLDAVELSFSYDNGALVWETIDDAAEYVIYDALTDETIDTVTTDSYTTSTEGRYYVVATSPNYLDSAKSNIIELRQLSSVSNVQVTNGKLNFSEFLVTGVKYIQIAVGQNTVENTTGELDIATYGFGQYSFKCVGESQVSSDGVTIYYMDSQTTQYTVAQMDSIAPGDNEITIANQVISWNAFGNGVTLNSLVYYVYFVDTNGNYARYETSSTSVNYYQVTTLLSSLENGLATGDLTVYVVAYLGSYQVGASGTIYYTSQKAVFGEVTLYNHYTYQSNSEIRKLEEPEVVGVNFSSKFTQRPDIEITFEGDYGENASFNIYIIGENSNLTVETSVSATSSGNGCSYTFTISASEYYYWEFVSNGVLEIMISVAGTDENINNVLSSTILTINQFDNISNLSFTTATIEEISLTYNTHELKIDKGDALGNVILVLTATTSTGSQTETIEVTTSTYDLSDFISNYLSEGGTLTISAYISSYSGENAYYLPSANNYSQTYTILATPSIQRNSSGFVIADDNAVEVYYIIYVGENEMYYISNQSDLNFILPDGLTETMTYSIFAVTGATGASELYLVSGILSGTYDIDRLDIITDITFGRNESNQIIVSWSEVDGATGYEINVYTYLADGSYEYVTTISLTNFASHTDNDTITYTSSELFGENYSTLTAYLTNLADGGKLRLEFIAKGDELKNDSQLQPVSVEIASNNIASTDVQSVNGVVTYERESDIDYLYRIQSAQSVLVGWTEMTQDIINTASLTEESVFYVQILTLGDLSDATNIILDSVWTLSDEFVKSLGIQNISYNEQTIDTIYFTWKSVAGEKIYVSTESDGIFTGNFYEFEPTLTENLDLEPDEYLYTYSLLEILEALGVDSYQQLYFWALNGKETFEYVVSDSYSSFVYNFEGSVNFYEEGGGGHIVKDENNINTYALFTKTDTTKGILVKIIQDDQSYIKFVSLDELIQYAVELNSEDYFAVNLVDVLDNLTDENGDAIELTGELSICFKRISIINEIYTVSAQSEEIVFTRVASVATVDLSRGNIVWSINDPNAVAYYVYFYTKIDADAYTIISTTSTSFNASKFAGEDSSYYLAVRSIGEGLYTLSSKLTFKLDDDGEPLEVIKNQINSPLTLKDGTLSINWSVEDELYILLTTPSNEGLSDLELAYTLYQTTFTSPFTFTLYDLVNGELTICLRFTNQDGVYAQNIYSVDASLFLSSLLNLAENNDVSADVILNNLQRAYNAVQDDEMWAVLGDFITLVQSGSYGVANQNTIFDQYFETLPTGAYKLEYCLVGESRTLNSTWYTFSNGLGGEVDDIIYVNPTPDVSVTTSTDSYLTSYIITFKKSLIWTYKEGAFVQETAENYVMILGDYSFSIVKGSSGYSLSLNDTSSSQTVSLTVSEDGNSISIYLNYNNGNSILGVFESLFEGYGAMEMQIYAVGTDYSASSKSEYYSVTFLEFESLSVTDGEIRWVSQYNRATTVLIQRNSESLIEETVEGVGDSTKSFRFSLSGYPSGTYNLRFIIRGTVSNNVIYVDSATYYLSKVYKLASPTITNTYGYLVINGSVNSDRISNSYIGSSDSGDYRYELYNDVSTSEVTYTLTSNSSSTNYAVGTTGMVGESEYKQTEASATSFTVSQLGSTAVLTEDESSSSGSNYYLKNVVCEESPSSYVALKSEEVTINASMLDAVTNVRVNSDGVLVWDAVEGRTTNEDTLALSNGEIIYKVTVTTYETNYTGSNITANEDVESEVFYTKLTSFDFKNLTISTTGLYIRVTVQAFGGTDVGDGLQLVEGGYVGGEIQYTDETYVLMGDGGELSGLTQVDAVTNLAVTEDGELTWLFGVPTLYEVTSSTLLTYYRFIVTDSEGNEIDGTFEVLDTASSDPTVIEFKIIFHESAGSIASGTQTLTIYATKSATNSMLLVKSIGKSFSVTKLAILGEGDYEIVSGTDEETLTFENYFQNSGNSDIYLVVTVVVKNGDDEEETYIFELDAENNYLNIIREGSVNVDARILVIDNDSVMTITVVAKCVNPQLNNILFSDESEEIVLQRSYGASDVTWDETTQTFSWSFEQSDLSENPVYIVQATYYSYYENENSYIIDQERVYTTTEKNFTPTVSGYVSIEVIVKIDSNNLQSISVGSQVAQFNLFDGGDGTSANPYIISSKEQFDNIIYRMTKDSYLSSYQQNSITQSEENKFYFSLQVNLDLGEFEGFYFSGNFGGVLVGNNNTITYTSTGVSDLTSSITIESTNTILSLTSGGLTYTAGSALFETFTSTAGASDLILQVQFGETYTSIARNALMSGLVISNAGTISGVEVTSFETYFYGDSVTRYAHAYSGIASINQSSATISNCTISTSVIINDNNQSVMISFGGICYTNYGSISGCVSGADTTQSVTMNCNARADFVQIGGIVVTNTSSSTMENCTNNYAFVVSASESNDIACYVGGVVALAKSGFSATNSNANGECSFTGGSTSWVWGTNYATLS